MVELRGERVRWAGLSAAGGICSLYRWCCINKKAVDWESQSNIVLRVVIMRHTVIVRSKHPEYMVRRSLGALLVSVKLLNNGSLPLKPNLGHRRGRPNSPSATPNNTEMRPACFRSAGFVPWTVAV